MDLQGSRLAEAFKIYSFFFFFFFKRLYELMFSLRPLTNSNTTTCHDLKNRLLERIVHSHLNGAHVAFLHYQYLFFFSFFFC